MQAIEVKFLPATATKPSRLKAIAGGGMTLTRSNLSSHPDSIEKRAYQVAEELASQLKGHQGIAGWGVLKNGHFVFTLAPRQ
jgi:hypothetical protein